MAKRESIFDPRISFGHVLIILSLVGTIMVAYSNLRLTDQALAAEQAIMEEHQRTTAEILESLVNHHDRVEPGWRTVN